MSLTLEKLGNFIIIILHYKEVRHSRACVFIGFYFFKKPLSSHFTTYHPPHSLPDGDIFKCL